MVAVQKKEEAQGLLLLAASLIPIHMLQIAKDAFASSSADEPRELPHGMGACVGMVSSLAFQAAYTSGGDRS
jgi:hypothetical protein